jgi:hypothetical protein
VLRESGFNAISIGKGSNGPLLELAAIKEFAEPLKPKIVLWVYYENDLGDLDKELKSTILKKYLNEKKFSQNLISRQKEIDSVLIDYVEGIRVERKKEWWIYNRIFRILRLFNLRTRINLIIKMMFSGKLGEGYFLENLQRIEAWIARQDGPDIKLKTNSKPEPKPNSKPSSKPEPKPSPILKAILKKSKLMVSSWGGKMYFIYLPSFYSLTGNENINRELVLDTVTELETPIIDIYREVFVPHPDPLSLFPFKSFGHYTAEGYRLVAESIAN